MTDLSSWHHPLLFLIWPHNLPTYLLIIRRGRRLKYCLQGAAKRLPHPAAKPARQAIGFPGYSSQHWYLVSMVPRAFAAHKFVRIRARLRLTLRAACAQSASGLLLSGRCFLLCGYVVLAVTSDIFINGGVFLPGIGYQQHFKDASSSLVQRALCCITGALSSPPVCPTTIPASSAKIFRRQAPFPTLSPAPEP